MVPREKDDIGATESDEEILACDVSDEALERAAPIIGGQATMAPRSLEIAPVPYDYVR